MPPGAGDDDEAERDGIDRQPRVGLLDAPALLGHGASTSTSASASGAESSSSEDDALLAPEVLRPLEYDLHLYPAGPPSFATEGVVDIRVEAPARRLASLYLHSCGLRIHTAALLPLLGPEARERPAAAAAVATTQVTPQVLRVDCPPGVALEPGQQYTLRLCFTGGVDVGRMDGVYACSWAAADRVEGGEGGAKKGDAGDDWIVATHFEPANARKAFPCWDAPSYKARFRITLYSSGGLLSGCAISNTPAEFDGAFDPAMAPRLGEAGAALLARIPQEQGQGQGQGPVRVTRFQPTPPLSTYVLGFWLGRFQLLQEEEGAQQADGTTRIALHLPPDRPLAEGRFSLEVARGAFDFFSNLFAPEVPFPLPKLDLIALPSMHGVGMEAFGAITILEPYLLVSEATEFVRRRRITRLLCHEISHQWLGDIATPSSFDQLWLKESTARLLEYTAVATLRPGWRMWTNFINEVYCAAIFADANPATSHPVVMHHTSVESVIAAFDVLTYGKGACLLRMLAETLGLPTFIGGLRRYLARFAYKSTTSDDLWLCIQEEANAAAAATATQPIDVRRLMDPWLLRAGVPALHAHIVTPPSSSPSTAAAAGNGGGQARAQLVLAQGAFSLFGAATKLPIVNPDQQRCLPLRVRVGVGAGAKAETKAATLVLGEDGPARLDLPWAADEPGLWLVVNTDHAAYCHTVYACPVAWALVLRALAQRRMTEVEVAGLLVDLFLGVQAALRQESLVLRRHLYPPFEAGGGGGGGAGSPRPYPSSPRAAGNDGNGSTHNPPPMAFQAQHQDLGVLLTRLGDVVAVLAQQAREEVAESEGGEGSPTAATTSALCDGRVFLWEVRLLELSHALDALEATQEGGSVGPFCMEEAQFGRRGEDRGPKARALAGQLREVVGQVEVCLGRVAAQARGDETLGEQVHKLELVRAKAAKLLGYGEAVGGDGGGGGRV